MAYMEKELRNIRAIAEKEFTESVTSRRFLLISAFYVGMATLLTVLSVLFFYSNEYVYYMPDFNPTMVLQLMSVLNFALALLAVIVSSDAISLEKSSRTIYQLMSKPVERSSVILGKFLGSLGVVTVLFLGSTILAYAVTALVTLKFPPLGQIPMVVVGLLSMVLLFAVYIALGILISAVTKNPYISIIGSILAWIGLMFASTIGNMLGSVVVGNGMVSIGSKAFAEYDVWWKLAVWLDPLSHSIMQPLLAAHIPAEVMGLPIWGHALFLILYILVLLTAAVALFNYQDL